MTFIHEIVSEIRGPGRPLPGAGEPTPAASAALSEEQFEELVERVVDTVLERLAQRWQE